MLLDAKCRKCRAVGEKLFLKGERCYSPKCSFLRKPTKPGVHKSKQGKFYGALSEYGRQILEKQRVKLTYGINERQLRRYFKEANQKKGSTVEILFKKLEMRLDNIVFRLGFAPSRRIARQLVSHGHFLVDGQPVRVPSFELKTGNVIKVRPASIEKRPFKILKENLKKYQPPSFLSLDPERLEGEVKNQPSMVDLKMPFNLNLIVEFYSK